MCFVCGVADSGCHSLENWVMKQLTNAATFRHSSGPAAVDFKTSVLVRRPWFLLLLFIKAMMMMIRVRNLPTT